MKKMVFRKEFIGWGLVLALPPLIPLIPIFAFSAVGAHQLDGLAWWTAAAGNMLESAFRSPSEAAIFMVLVTMHIAGVLLCFFGLFVRRPEPSP